MVTLLVSIPLAWLGYERRHAESAVQTLRQIRDCGGRGHFLATDRPHVLHRLMGREPRIWFIDFPKQCEFADAELDLLAKLRSVPGLSLQNTAVSHDGIEKLAVIEGLSRLDLRNTTVDDEAVQWLCEIEGLEVLDIRNTAITDAGMKRLAQIMTLRALHVAGEGITDDGILAFNDHPSLEFLNVSDSRVTDAGIVVATRLPRLRTLLFARTSVSNEGLRMIQSCAAIAGDRDERNQGERQLGSNHEAEYELATLSEKSAATLVRSF